MRAEDLYLLHNYAGTSLNSPFSIAFTVFAYQWGCSSILWFPPFKIERVYFLYFTAEITFNLQRPLLHLRMFSLSQIAVIEKNLLKQYVFVDPLKKLKK